MAIAQAMGHGRGRKTPPRKPPTNIPGYMNERQKLAMAHPCGRAAEVLHPRYPADGAFADEELAVPIGVDDQPVTEHLPGHPRVTRPRPMYQPLLTLA